MKNFLPADLHIEFIFEGIDKFPFPEENFRKWILAIIDSENKEAGELNFILCNDDFLLQINKEYLSHDTFTDIITFDYSEDFGNVSGDIYISVDRVTENADSFQVDFMTELARVLAHGVLHIIGYKDKIKKDEELMRQKENYYLQVIDFL